MSFNYERSRQKSEEGSNWWTSYADLFMMLSVVFLLMYVCASLRSGAAGYLKQVEFEQIAKENNDLKEQIKVYNALKDQQLSQKSPDEQEVYSKLMDKLKLLQEDAKSEKEDLQKQAKENEAKEFALNQYQQMIRNIINANILAKAQIQRREQIIQTKDQTLTEKEKVISAQDQQIHEKEQLIAQNEAQIDAAHEKLKHKIEQLRREQKWAHHTRAQTEKQIAKLKAETARQVQTLAARKSAAEHELNRVRGSLAATEGQLNATKGALDATKGALDETKGKLQSVQGNLVATKGKLNEIEGSLEDTQSKLGHTKAVLEQAQKEKGRYMAAVGDLTKKNQEIEGDLAKARALAHARKDLAASIAANFKKAGIKANVDTGTGDVTLDFGEEYFDTGRAELKPAMKKKLDQFFPIYAQSLFNHPKTADKIANVEIIGFASSTYKGKYVRPDSLKPEDKEAVSYNLKLSFTRANEIFKHIYAKNSMTDAQKQKLLPMVKVVGRGYLPEGKNATDIPEGISETQFCKLYSCKKAQRVIVKFNLKD